MGNCTNDRITGWPKKVSRNCSPLNALFSGVKVSRKLLFIMTALCRILYWPIFQIFSLALSVENLR